MTKEEIKCWFVEEILDRYFFFDRKSTEVEIYSETPGTIRFILSAKAAALDISVQETLESLVLLQGEKKFPFWVHLQVSFILR